AHAPRVFRAGPRLARDADPRSPGSRHAARRPVHRRGVRCNLCRAARRARRAGPLRQHRHRAWTGDLTMSTPRDPIGFELFKNTLLSIADEMALTVLRTAYSGVLKDNMDYSTAFCDGGGRTVAQGLTLPAHLSSFPDALAATIARFGDRMKPGDVYCL